MATILVTTDRLLTRCYLTLVLKHQGYHVLEADSSALALSVIHGARPNLALIDVLLPHPGAYQLIRQIRNESKTALPLALLASPAMHGEARLLANACGISRIVADIADPEALLALVEAMLSDPSATSGPSATSTTGESEKAPGKATKFYLTVSRLYRRVADLESCNARLKHDISTSAQQLQEARSALDREVVKRRWTEQQLTQENQRLRARSLHDPLTGLPNRRYLEEALSREMSRAKRNGKPLSMMLIDIDNFKHCNDTFGNAAGDAVLRAVSRYMNSLARSDDILCRYGDEEFALVITNTAPAMLRQRANSLRSSIPKLRIEHDRQHIGPITLSIGLAIFPDSGDSAAVLLQAADATLCLAKSAGPDCIVGGGMRAH